MKRFLSILCAIVAPALIAGAQPMAGAPFEEQLKHLFPEAVSFSEKDGTPPHYKAYGPPQDGGEPELLGLVFWTTELDPLERGYDGPIQLLVGMDTRGILTRVIVTDHREPYGYFSVELPEFAEQFEGKNIRDRFRYGEDIDAISRATVTVVSASRAVRNSARRAATAHLAPPAQ
ncbi:MAG TPA: FMN-binding protein [Gammaproteobacteria bacterium]|nr:FMN-binding protein [Gammaproteobacteria bacterium]